MKKNTKKIMYSEPMDYFPKEIRKKNKLGEFADGKDSAPAKKKVKRK